MATINPLIPFLVGIITIILAITIFYFAARQNQNVANFYRATICSGIA
jgi:hypothetical protein